MSPITTTKNFSGSIFREATDKLILFSHIIEELQVITI